MVVAVWGPFLPTICPLGRHKGEGGGRQAGRQEGEPHSSTTFPGNKLMVAAVWEGVTWVEEGVRGKSNSTTTNKIRSTRVGEGNKGQGGSIRSGNCLNQGKKGEFSSPLAGGR